MKLGVGHFNISGVDTNNQFNFEMMTTLQVIQHDSQDRSVWAGSLDRSLWTDRPDMSAGTDQPGQDTEERKVRT
jgi:hypothetical protein